MRHIFPLLYLTLFLTVNTMAQDAREKKEVIQVAQQFFDALEKGDSLAFYSVFLKNAFNYYVTGEKDSVRTGSQSPFQARFSSNRIIKERMRETGVIIHVHERIATAWVPYDLWVNDVYSHCGVDVFTLLKTSEGWKIASLAFSMEKHNCK